MAFVFEEEQTAGRFVFEDEEPQTTLIKTKSKLENAVDALEKNPLHKPEINKKGVEFLENAIVGTVETTAGLALGMTGWAGGTLAGLTTYILTGDEKAAQAVSEGTAQQIQGNFQPKTEFGKASTEVISHAIEGVFGLVHEGAEWTAGQMQDNPINKLILDMPEDQLLRLDPITQTSLRTYRHFFNTREQKTYLLKIAGEVAAGKAMHTTGVKGIEITKALPDYLKQITGRNADPARVVSEKTKTAELTKQADGGKIPIEEKHYEYFARRFEEAGIDPVKSTEALDVIRRSDRDVGGDIGSRVLDPLQEQGIITGELRNTLYKEWQTWDALRTAKDTSNIKESGDVLGRSVDEKRAADLSRKTEEFKKLTPEERAINATKASLEEMRQGWKSQGISNFVSEKNGVIRLSEIQIPKEKRKQGIGTGAMQELVGYADRTGQKIILTPSTDFGATSVSRLEKFYKRFGFESNKGKNADLRYSETMIRTPQKAQEGKAEPGPLSQLQAEGQRGSITFGRTPEKPTLHEFPSDIQSRWDAALPKEATFRERIGEKLDEFYNKATRTFEDLPRTGEYAPLQFELLNLLKYKGIASDKATRLIEKNVRGMDKQLYDIYEKKVILDDLAYSAEKGMNLPFGFTPDRLGAEKILIDNLASKHPEIQRAINARKAAWDELKKDYTKSMEDIGFDVGERFKNPDYFHHQVLEMSRARNLSGAGQKLKTPAGRGFLKRREGSEKDINRDYIQVEHDVMAQMIHDIKVAETIKFVDGKYNIAQQVKGEYMVQLEALYKKISGDAKMEKLAWNQRNKYGLKKKIHELDSKALEKAGLEEWRGLLPEGYELWQPREGQVFYMTDTIPSQIAKDLISGALDEFGVTAKDIKQSLALGGPRREFVLKKEIINTLDNLTKKPDTNIISKSSAWIMRQWKEKIALIHPRSFFKYNTRNMTGDAEGVFIGNPGGFKKAPQAFRDLYNALYGDGKMTPELQKFFDFGGFESTMQAIEMRSFGEMGVFKHLYDQKKNIREIPSALWDKYWKTARLATDFRESLLRYANFLEYREQMLRSPDGLPKNYGASIPEEIKALSNLDQRAYWLQNDLLGAYDRIGVIGQHLRNHIWPFWSWKEVNARRFIQVVRNAAEEGHLASTVGKKLGAKTPYMAYKIGGLAIKLSGILALLEIYNNTFFPEEEADLPENVRDQAHIIFGRDSEGKVLYFDRLGIVKDFLGNFGLDVAPGEVRDVLHGKKTIKEMAANIAKAPLNTFVSGISPLYKLPAELLTRQKSFPDVTKRGTIRDRKLYIAEQLKLGAEYKAIMGLPSKGYGETLKNLFIYSADPGQSAYFAIMDRKRRYAEKNGKGGEGYFITPRGDALYNYKLAMRYGDEKAAENYFDKYITLGGTYDGFKQSMRAMHPLWGLNDYEKMDFTMSLDAEDSARLDKAMDYYIDNLDMN